MTPVLFLRHTKTGLADKNWALGVGVRTTSLVFPLKTTDRLSLYDSVPFWELALGVGILTHMLESPYAIHKHFSIEKC